MSLGDQTVGGATFQYCIGIYETAARTTIDPDHSRSYNKEESGTGITW